MIFPETTFEEWVEKYPDLILGNDCEINFCTHCENRIQPKIPFIKKGYVGLISYKCPTCEKDCHTQVSITNSLEETLKWSSII